MRYLITLGCLVNVVFCFEPQKGITTFTNSQNITWIVGGKSNSQSSRVREITDASGTYISQNPGIVWIKGRNGKMEITDFEDMQAFLQNLAIAKPLARKKSCAQLHQGVTEEVGNIVISTFNENGELMDS